MLYKNRCLFVGSDNRVNPSNLEFCSSGDAGCRSGGSGKIQHTVLMWRIEKEAIVSHLIVKSKCNGY